MFCFPTAITLQLPRKYESAASRRLITEMSMGSSVSIAREYGTVRRVRVEVRELHKFNSSIQGVGYGACKLSDLGV